MGRWIARISCASCAPCNKALIWVPCALVPGFENTGQSRGSVSCRVARCSRRETKGTIQDLAVHHEVQKHRAPDHPC